MKKFFTLIAVAAMAFAAQANVLTLCDGEDTNTAVPIYGLYADVTGTLGQMIYTPVMLDEMEGGKITQVKFYSSGIIVNDIINFSINFDISLLIATFAPKRHHEAKGIQK